MKNYKQLALFSISGILLSIVFIILINYIIDPFGIFDTKFLKYQGQLNERYVKIEFLKKNHNKYNSYLLGSSRIGTTDPAIIEKYIPGSKFYNMTISGPSIYDEYLILDYFVKNNYDIKNIYLQVDVLENFIQYKSFDHDLLRKYPPVMFNNDTFHFYLSYLVSLSFESMKTKIKVNQKKQNEIIFDIENTGRWYRPIKEKQLQEDPEEYIKNEPSFHKKYYRTVKDRYSDQNLIQLKKIKELCKKHNINLIVFITPHNHNLMDRIVLEDYYEFLKNMANITDYWNFSGYNAVTSNDHNYYEESHYLPNVVELIAARIFNNEKITVPDDFGFWVTKENSKQHVTYLKQHITK